MGASAHTRPPSFPDACAPIRWRTGRRCEGCQRQRITTDFGVDSPGLFADDENCEGAWLEGSSTGAGGSRSELGSYEQDVACLSIQR